MKLIGKVVDNKDPLKSHRLRVVIDGYNNGIDKKFLGWFEPASTTLSQMSQAAAIDEWVEVDMTENNISWKFLDLKEKALLDLLGDDLLKSIVISYRNLESQGDKGKFGMMWTKTNGYQVFIDESKMQIRQKDGSVFMTDSKFIMHIKDGKLSLGQEDKSAEPAVLGDKNVDALKALATEIDNLNKEVTKINTGLTTFCATQSAAAGSVSILAPLIGGYSALTAITTPIASSLPKITASLTKIKSKEIPATKSKKVTLD